MGPLYCGLSMRTTDTGQEKSVILNAVLLEMKLVKVLMLDATSKECHPMKGCKKEHIGAKVAFKDIVLLVSENKYKFKHVVGHTCYITRT